MIFNFERKLHFRTIRISKIIKNFVMVTKSTNHFYNVKLFLLDKIGMQHIKELK